MLSDNITEEQLRIRIHHVGGSGGYGPSGVLDKLDHVEWIIYDANEESLSSSKKPESGRWSLINRSIGGTNSREKFHITFIPSASSMLMMAPSAAAYTVMLPNDTARIWGTHARVTKSVDVQVNTLDWLVENNEVPPVDFLSIDAQGAELLILNGASEMLRTWTVGVLCEVEFAELYDGQPLFCDTQSRLRKDHFRLCEIYSHQYLNTAPLCNEIQGKGFLTVGEALFLKDKEIWVCGEISCSPLTSIQDVIQTLKLAAIAVAFDQLDYALGLCRCLEKKQLVSLDRLADQSNVKYVKLLRDLCHAADLIQANTGPPPLESSNISYEEKTTTLPQELSKLFKLIRFIIPARFRKLMRETLKRNVPKSYPLMSKILYTYGLKEIAAKHAMRAAKCQYLNNLYTRVWEKLVS